MLDKVWFQDHPYLQGVSRLILKIYWGWCVNVLYYFFLGPPKAEACGEDRPEGKECKRGEGKEGWGSGGPCGGRPELGADPALRSWSGSCWNCHKPCWGDGEPHEKCPWYGKFLVEMWAILSGDEKVQGATRSSAWFPNPWHWWCTWELVNEPSRSKPRANRWTWDQPPASVISCLEVGWAQGGWNFPAFGPRSSIQIGCWSWSFRGCPQHWWRTEGIWGRWEGRRWSGKGEGKRRYPRSSQSRWTAFGFRSQAWRRWGWDRGAPEQECRVLPLKVQSLWITLLGC